MGHPAPEGLRATKIPAFFGFPVLNGKPRAASRAVAWPFGRPHEQSKEAEIRGTTSRKCFAVHRSSGASTTKETHSHGFRVPLRPNAPPVATTLDPFRVIPTAPACLTRGTNRINRRSFSCVAGCGSTKSRLIPCGRSGDNLPIEQTYTKAKTPEQVIPNHGQRSLKKRAAAPA